ncbi:MAG: LruC domain-containing protein [Bacteroides sp.]|nr:LruC domain-containing protein [Bacteroides sp.]
MKTTKSYRMLTLMSAAFMLGVFSGCVEDVYDGETPVDSSKGEVLSPDSYFSFNTKADVTLNVNYDMYGMPALIEVYGENPVLTDGLVRTKRTDISPLFAAFTDDKGQFNGTMNIPTSLETVYLYTREMGYPECVALNLENNAFTFDVTASAADAEVATRAYRFNGNVPYTLSERNNLYSLCSWGSHGVISTSGYLTENSTIPVKNDAGEDSTEGISSFVGRLKTLLWKNADEKPEGLDNTYLLNGVTVDQLNLYTSEAAEISLMFLHERAGYKNTFGYYYYKGSGEKDVTNLKKYVLFPNVSIVGDDPYNTGRDYSGPSRILKAGESVKLLFFGENGDEAATTKFPEGYTIGWFMISDAYNTRNNEINTSKTMLTSNGSNAYISVYDQKLHGVVIGIEDGGDKSYEDMLFCLFTTPDIVDPENPGRPYIPEKGGEILPATETTSGTYAFEDIWPTGGDYDMNDVVVEYKREITFTSDNYVTKIVDTFTPVHDGATYQNAFAYQIDESQMGTVTTESGCTVESATNSIIVFADAKAATAAGQSYIITRTFAEKTLLKTDLKEYNPYIIVGYEEGATSRVEVHLPKHAGTSYADKSLNYTEDDAYYIDKSGKYPFAIDLPITDFTVVTERSRIDADVEYPTFKTWADSKGTECKEWYKEYKGGK